MQVKKILSSLAFFARVEYNENMKKKQQVGIAEKPEEKKK